MESLVPSEVEQMNIAEAIVERTIEFDERPDGSFQRDQQLEIALGIFHSLMEKAQLEGSEFEEWRIDLASYLGNCYQKGLADYPNAFVWRKYMYQASESKNDQHNAEIALIWILEDIFNKCQDDELENKIISWVREIRSPQEVFASTVHLPGNWHDLRGDH